MSTRSETCSERVTQAPSEPSWELTSRGQVLARVTPGMARAVLQKTLSTSLDLLDTSSVRDGSIGVLFQADHLESLVHAMGDVRVVVDGSRARHLSSARDGIFLIIQEPRAYLPLESSCEVTRLPGTLESLVPSRLAICGALTGVTLGSGLLGLVNLDTIGVSSMPHHDLDCQTHTGQSIIVADVVQALTSVVSPLVTTLVVRPRTAAASASIVIVSTAMKSSP